MAALARCVPVDIERAAKALEKAKGAPRIHVFLATSDIHLKHKLKKTREQVLEEAAKGRRAGAQATSTTSSSPPRTAAAPGSTIWCRCRGPSSPPAPGRSTSPTPSGTASPRSTARSSARSSKALGTSAVVSVHCHDDLGLAVANSLAAIAERRPPDRVHHQRHRRAGRQLLARGDRDGAEDAPRSAAVRHRHPDRAALSRQPASDRAHRRRAFSPTRRSSARTPSRTRPASTRTAS